MAISELTTSLPRRLESFKLLSLDFVIETANGELSSFVIPNNSGKIYADFTKPDAQPRSTTGSVKVQDGGGNVVIDVPEATITIEQGTATPDWPGVILGAISVQGMDVNGNLWAGRSTGVNEADPTSISFEFGMSDKNNANAQEQDLKKWLKDGSAA